MTDHYRDFDLATSQRWNKLACSKESRNLLVRDLILEEVTLHTDGQQGNILFEDCDVKLMRGKRYGLVGRNGCGKTTLMRHIAQKRIMGIYDHLRCIYVDDGTEALYEDSTSSAAEGDAATAAGKITVKEYLMSKHVERKKALESLHDVMQAFEEEGEGEEAQANDAQRKPKIDLDVLQDVSERLDLILADATEARLAKILAGLGVDPEQTMETLSGGYRHRVALAVALFLEADVLLLDEPTTHLDLTAIYYLTQFLNTQCKNTAVAVVSHDIHFLEAITTDILTIEEKKLTAFRGSFNRYVETRQQKREKHERMYLAQEKVRTKLQESIKKLQARATKYPDSSDKIAGAIRMRQKQLTTRLGVCLEKNVRWKYGLMGPRPEIMAPIDELPFEFDLPTDVDDVPDGGSLVKLNGAMWIYKNSATGSAEVKKKAIFAQPVTLDITIDSRLAIVGQNGSGKTTLLNLIEAACRGEERANPSEREITGETMRWHGLRVGVFRQHAVKDLSLNSEAKTLTPFQWLTRRHPDLGTLATRKALVDYGVMTLDSKLNSVAFTPEDPRPVAVMSDGQRARLLLASIMVDKPHLLLLDEPTTHLDVETASAIATAIQYFDGAVVCASHDIPFLSAISDDVYCLDADRFGPWKDEVEDYRDHVLASCMEQTKKAAQAKATKQQQPSTAASSHADPKAADASKIAEAKATKAAGPVTCRLCQGDHFTFSCPEKERLLEEQARERAEQAAAKPKFKTPQPSQQGQPKLKLRETARDGQGDWKVVVPKQVQKQMKKGNDA